MTVEAGVVWPRRSDVREAFSPWVEQGDVQWLQITVEHAFRGELSESYTGPLDRASAAGTLVGHAVHASPLTVPRDRVAHDWLRRTRAVLDRWPVRWLTDHFGCCRAGGWHAAPLPLPASAELVRAGRDHLDWVQDALQVPVGLENLALALCTDDVLAQPDLVDAMVRPVGGLVLLDLHNLWCQAVNYDLDPIGLLERWPLDLVRQLHVAGGSWSSYPEGRFRRDTHDGPVPDEVWDLVPEAVARCPSAEVVVLERLRGTVTDIAELSAEVEALTERLASDPTGVARSLPPAPEWGSTDPAVVGPALFAAVRTGDHAALQAAAPDWTLDPRALRVACEVTEKWGRAVPID